MYYEGVFLGPTFGLDGGIVASHSCTELQVAANYKKSCITENSRPKTETTIVMIKMLQSLEALVVAECSAKPYPIYGCNICIAFLLETILSANNKLFTPSVDAINHFNKV